ncbi:type VII toxin-antitoxin system MntA family adenylyltransferase antitoxin [Cyanobacterium aponinum]|uniref:DNA polymerase beta domain protein region n=1 Tax=Cyanobacterium aponinum (strain PCC 10605) TaxID=755178 RepID=K9Z8Q5_CYAAP|nr:nucleotidyltransferase domain-containing protein [Cyanobacterium aponinum]AFZ54733.1 DNA polymerase beta domain protein region [Cyanobacterium aponinum PCC 10605]
MNNQNIDIKELQNLSQKIPEKMPYIKMVILFGSRARGDINDKSDWDFAILCDREIVAKTFKNKVSSWFAYSVNLNEIFDLKTERIDIIDLNSCSDFIAHYIARDGVLIYEKNEGEFEHFRREKLKTESQMNVISKNLRAEIEEFLSECGV